AGDGEHARARAEVVERSPAAFGRERDQELAAHPRRRMRSRAERLAGVHDDVGGARRGRIRPRGPDPDPAADQDRAVEVAPAVGPAAGHGSRDDLDQRPARRRLDRPDLGQLAGRAVEGVLDEVAVARFLEPARNEGEQLGEHRLGLLGPAADGEPDHVRDRAATPASPSASASWRAASRCLRLSFRGRTTFSTTYSSPRAVPPRPGRPMPRRRTWSPCWAPGGISIGWSPFSVGASTVPPSIAVVTGTSTTATRSRPSRRRFSSSATTTRT